MSVKTYRPGFTVDLYKNVFRNNGVSQRQQAGQHSGDGVMAITPYLGDGSRISTSKDLYKPCGSFVLTVPDQPFVTETGKSAADTLYGLCEPMDGIDLRLARSPEQYGGELPVQMFGLIREVSRDEAMGRDGKPVRRVIIKGQDYGCIFANILRIIYLKKDIQGPLIPDEFKWIEAIGDAFVLKSAADYMRIFINMANRFLSRINSDRGGWAWTIQEDITVSEGAVQIFGLHEWQGPIWSAMAREADFPWNELYVEDREAGPTLVYRPTPFKTYTPAGQGLSSSYIPQGGQTIAAETIEITASDIVHINATRGDYNAGNIFWLLNPNSLQANFAYATLGQAVISSDPDINDDDHENNDPRIYGDRLLQEDFRQIPMDVEGDPIRSRREQHRANNEQHWPNWFKTRLRWIKAANRDNVVLEEGEMTLKGNERIKVGCYLHVTRGQFAWECYVTNVSQEYAPYREFLTHVTFSRGTGFWERSLHEQSPYLLEGRRGVYAGD
ncbi:MAG: hypothetical protein RKO24_07360 [Candidatus Competibacter sp.]|nr:hypothetical protein [Candidatus Competibacter sp.]